MRCYWEAHEIGRVKYDEHKEIIVLFDTADRIIVELDFADSKSFPATLTADEILMMLLEIFEEIHVEEDQYGREIFI